MLQRQTSFREFGRLQSTTSPFKRQLSLRLSELPSSLERKAALNGLAFDNSSQNNPGQINPVASLPTEASSESAMIETAVGNIPKAQNTEELKKICEQLSKEPFFPPQQLFNSLQFTKVELSTVPEDDGTASPSASNASTKGGGESSLNTSFSFPAPNESESNPWDLVPDQPAKAKTPVGGEGADPTAKTFNQDLDENNSTSEQAIINTNANNSDPFSPLTTNPPSSITMDSSTVLPPSKIMANSNGFDSDSDSAFFGIVPSSEGEPDNKDQEDEEEVEKQPEVSKASNSEKPEIEKILDDPFDADWVSLALSQNGTKT